MTQKLDNFETEVWKPIESYESTHQVSTFGRIKFIRTNHIRFGTLGTDGYVRVSLRNKIGDKSHSVHRLVAKAFIDNPLNKPFINHKDGIKSNNHCSNLEWVTASENSYHAVKLGKKLVSKSTRLKISTSLIGIKRKPYTDEHRKKLRDAFLGKKLSDSHKLKIKIAMQQKYLRVLQLTLNNIPIGLFNSCRDAAKLCRLSSASAISAICRKRTGTCGGFKWRYVV